jgi:hypothetical protein
VSRQIYNVGEFFRGFHDYSAIQQIYQENPALLGDWIPYAQIYTIKTGIEIDPNVLRVIIRRNPHLVNGEYVPYESGKTRPDMDVLRSILERNPKLIQNMSALTRVYNRRAKESFLTELTYRQLKYWFAGRGLEAIAPEE